MSSESEAVLNQEQPSLDLTEGWDMKDEKLMAKMYRGETPEDIEKTCHQLCADYLRGTWAKIKPEEMVFRRISGGMTNQLYYCGIPDGVETEDGEPRELAVRMYGKKWFNYYECEIKDERVTDMIIAVMMSDKKIGPKIYGISSVGEVQEYIDCRPFFEPEEQDPSMVKELAVKLAQIHYMNVPIKRTNTYFKTLVEWNKKYREMYTNEYFISKGCNYIQKMNFTEEIEFIRRCAEALDTLTVFNHNDFRNTNILVKNKFDGDGNLRIGDYEYGAYGYRGQDLGWLFSQWGQSKVTLEPMFPSDEELSGFFMFYVNECIRINGPSYLKDPRNTIESLIKETKVFALGFTILTILIFLPVEDEDWEMLKQIFTKDQFIQFCDIAIRNYFLDRFINEKAIPEEAIWQRDLNNNPVEK